MRNLFVLTVLLFSLVTRAQFSGSIDFKYYTLRDTTDNVYWVKGNKIKLDQYAKKSKNIEGSFVFDLSEKTIKFVNPKRKVWGDQKSEIPPVVRGKCVSKKTGATKTIEGVKCKEYIVTNTEEDTEITYWIADNKLDFFVPMMELWNRKDKQSIYFSKIKGVSKGAMPFLSEERQISTKKFVSKLEVVSVNKGKVDDSNLSVPANYKKFEQ
ncbi:MAG: DUF4412 domain-containing protein [Bacteroidia bacterium]